MTAASFLRATKGKEAAGSTSVEVPIERKTWQELAASKAASSGSVG